MSEPTAKFRAGESAYARERATEEQLNRRVINLRQADLHVEEIYNLIKAHKDGIMLDDIAMRYPSRDATVPYVVGKLVADEKVKMEQRGDKLFCVVVDTNNVTTLEEYLLQSNIDPVFLAGVAGVRYLTVWHAQKGRPITRRNAQKIREAALKLTGVPYSGSFVLQESSTEKEMSTCL